MYVYGYDWVLGLHCVLGWFGLGLGPQELRYKSGPPDSPLTSEVPSPNSAAMGVMCVYGFVWFLVLHGVLVWFGLVVGPHRLWFIFGPPDPPLTSEVPSPNCVAMG